MSIDNFLFPIYYRTEPINISKDNSLLVFLKFKKNILEKSLKVTNGNLLTNFSSGQDA